MNWNIKLLNNLVICDQKTSVDLILSDSSLNSLKYTNTCNFPIIILFSNAIFELFFLLIFDYENHKQIKWIFVKIKLTFRFII